MRTPRLVLTAVSLGALVLASGCGPEANDSTAGRSSGKTDRGQSVLATLKTDVKQSLTKTQESATTANSVVISASGTASGEKISVRGAIAYGGDVKSELVLTAAGEVTTVRMLGTVCYVQIPVKERATFQGKTWMKIDLAQAGQEMLRNFSEMDPTKQLKTMIASGKVSVVGEDRIGDLPTVHYAATLPVASYLEQVNPSIQDSVRQQLSAQGVTEVKVDIWVDEQYQLRRSRSVAGTAVDMTVEYTDYGKPVAVDAPPAGETIDLGQMLGELGELGDLGA